jgi:hypothetical protein
MPSGHWPIPEVAFEVHEFRLPWTVGYLEAVAANDRDVMSGLPADGFLLDAIEDVERRVADEYMRALFWGPDD